MGVRRGLALGAAAALVLAACGSSAGSMQGSIGGVSLGVADAIAFTYIVGADYSTAVVLFDKPGICGDMSQGELPGNIKLLALDLSPVDVTDVTPGSYPFGTGPGNRLRYAQWEITDAACSAPVDVYATGGSVTVTSATSSTMTGTFDLTFGADHVTGTFVATHCVPIFPNGGVTCI